ncbi:MAG: hypothetical protein PHI18_02030, partial [bacterium]|nr:hypothetical protein [bacterium]
MFRCAVVIILGLALAVSAQSLLEQEENFFGIPGLVSLSTGWFMSKSDSTDPGFRYPVDMELLKLAPTDYRLVILDAYPPHFFTFRIDQQFGLRLGSIDCSGDAPDTCAYAIAMCPMQHDTFFDPQTDRIAVAFQYGAAFGIYKFDRRTGKFDLERSFTNIEITKPVGIFWAFDDFFVSDEVTQFIFRMDNQGNTISYYGGQGSSWEDSYYWVSDIAGYVDVSGKAHLYTTDASLLRVDHLIAYEQKADITLYSQVGSTSQDTMGFHVHEPAVIPQIGVLAFNRYLERFYFWHSLDSLNTASRTDEQWAIGTAVPVHVRETGGRLIVVSLDSVQGAWALYSFGVDNVIFDNPQPLPSDHWTTAISPVYITEAYHVTSGTELTIDAGVQVYFAQGASMTVDSGGILTVNGTQQNRVYFEAMDSTEIWAGIKVVGGQLVIDWARIKNTAPAAIWTDDPSGSAVPVQISNCNIEGDGIWLTGSPTLTQSVIHTTITDDQGTEGLY